MNRNIWFLCFLSFLGLTDPVQGQSDLSEDIPRLQDQFAKTPTPENLMQFSERSDDDIVILGLMLNRMILSDGFLAYQDGDDVWVPLGAIVSALEFPIDVDPRSGKASGWFLEETRIFSLDLSTGRLISGGKQVKVTADDIERHPDDIYVRLGAMQDWFPVHFKVNLQRLIITITSLELLPVEERIERKKRREKLRANGPGSADYATGKKPVPAFSWPYVDTSISVSANNNSTRSSQSLQYSSTAAGVFAGFDTQISLFGRDESDTPNLRILATRYRPGGGVLGIGPARRFTVGDVVSDNDPLIAKNTIGRGFELSSFRFNQVGDPKRITIRGELSAGWEVELYQNGILIDYITDSEDGRFTFADVASRAGLNVFRLVYYGPQGQKREEFQRFYASTGVLKPGESNFNLSLNQRNRDLVGTVGGNNGAPDDGAWRFIAAGEYGLTENLTATASLASISVDGERMSFVRTGLRGTLFGAFSGTDIAISDNGGIAAGVRTQTQIGRISLIAEHNRFKDFRSEVTNNGNFTGHLTAESLIRIAGNTPDIWRVNFPYTLSASYRKSDLGEKDLELFGRLSTRISNFTISAETLRNQRRTRNLTWNSAIRISTLFGDLRLRSEASFVHSPRNQLTSLQARADWSLTRRLGARFTLRHSRRGEKPMTFFGAGLNAELNSATMGLQVEISDDGNYTALFGLSFGWGPDPRSGRFFTAGRPFATQGLVSPFVFVDSNGNGVFDPEQDKPLPDVTFSARGVPINQQTDKNGKTLITHVPVYRDTALLIEEGSLKNPYLMPVSKGVRFFPRPGLATQIDFPVVETGEIDGTVYVLKGGQQQPISGIKLLLIDGQGAQLTETLTSFDGFYLFDRIPYGTYFVQPDQQQVELLSYQSDPPVEAVLDAEEPVVFGFDIILTPLYEEPVADVIVAEMTPVARPDSGQKEGQFAVHLFSLRYLTSAHDCWFSLAHQYGEMIESLEVRITDFQTESDTHYYRMNFGSFETESAARNFCSLLEKDGHYCRVTEYGGKSWVPLKEYN